MVSAMTSSSLPTHKGRLKDYTDLAIRLCDRRTGIGADGLAILVPSETCDAHAHHQLRW